MVSMGAVAAESWRESQLSAAGQSAVVGHLCRRGADSGRMPVGNMSDGSILSLSPEKEKLKFVWSIRARLRSEGEKLHSESKRLSDEGGRLYDESERVCGKAKRTRLHQRGITLLCKSDKLYYEGNQRWNDGDQLWKEAVIHVYGNITLRWKKGICTLETGDVFKP